MNEDENQNTIQHNTLRTKIITFPTVFHIYKDHKSLAAPVMKDMQASIPDLSERDVEKISSIHLMDTVQKNFNIYSYDDNIYLRASSHDGSWYYPLEDGQVGYAETLMKYVWQEIQPSLLPPYDVLLMHEGIFQTAKHFYEDITNIFRSDEEIVADIISRRANDLILVDGLLYEKKEPVVVLSKTRSLEFSLDLDQLSYLSFASSRHSLELMRRTFIETRGSLNLSFNRIPEIKAHWHPQVPSCPLGYDASIIYAMDMNFDVFKFDDELDHLCVSSINFLRYLQFGLRFLSDEVIEHYVDLQQAYDQKSRSDMRKQLDWFSTDEFRETMTSALVSNASLAHLRLEKFIHNKLNIACEIEDLVRTDMAQLRNITEHFESGLEIFRTLEALRRQPMLSA